MKKQRGLTLTMEQQKMVLEGIKTPTAPMQG